MADFQEIVVDGETLEFPVDMTDAEITAAITGKDSTPSQTGRTPPEAERGIMLPDAEGNPSSDPLGTFESPSDPTLSQTGRTSALDDPLAGEGLRQFLGFGQGAASGAAGTVDIFVPDELGGKNINALEKKLEAGAKEFGSPTAVEAGKLAGFGFGAGGVVAAVAKQMLKSPKALGVATVLSEIGGFVKKPVSKLLVEAAKDPKKLVLIETGIGGVAGAAGAQVPEDSPWIRLGVEMAASMGAAAAANKINDIATGLSSLNSQEREAFNVLTQSDDGIQLIEAGEKAIKDAGIKNSDVPLQTITGNPTIEASIANVRSNNAELDVFFRNADKKVLKALNNANPAKIDETSVIKAFDDYKTNLDDYINANVAKQKEIDAVPGDTASVSEALFGHLLKTEEAAHKAASARYDNIFADGNIRGVKLSTKDVLSELRGVMDVGDKGLLGSNLKNVSGIIKRMTGNSKRKLSASSQPNDLSVKDMQDIRSKIMGDVRSIRQSAAGDTSETVSLMRVADKISEQLEKVPQLKEANETWRVYKESFYDGQIARFFAKSATGKNKVDAERFVSSYITGSAPKAAARQLERIKKEFDPDGSNGLATNIDESIESGFFALLKAEQIGAAVSDKGVGRIAPATWRSFMKRNSTALKEYGLFDKFNTYRKAAERASNAQESIEQMERYGFSSATRGLDINEAIGSAIKEKGGLSKVLKMVEGNRFLKRAVKDRFMTSLLGLEKAESMPDPSAMVKAVKNNASAIREQMGEDAFRRAQATALIIHRTFSGIGRGATGTDTSLKQLISTEQGLRRVRGKVTAVIGTLYRRVFLLGMDVRETSASQKAIKLFQRAYTDPKVQQEIIKLAKKNPETFRMMYRFAMVPPVIASDDEIPAADDIKARVKGVLQ